MAALLLCLLQLTDGRPERILRNSLFDGYQMLLPRPPLAQGVIVIAIDDSSLAEIGQWPWPRSAMAALLQRLAALEPAAIGIDILFAEPDREPGLDGRLASALKTSGATLGVAGVEADPRLAETTGFRPPIIQDDPDRVIDDFVWRFPAALRSTRLLDAAAPGHGIINSLPQLPGSPDAPARAHNDSVVRQVPALAKAGASLLPGLGIEVLRQGLGESVLRVQLDGGGLRAVVLGGRAVPTDADGAWWIHYARPEGRAMLRAAPFVNGKFPAEFDPEKLRGRVVLIGVAANGLGDLATTPLGLIPGVAVHAEAIDNFLSGRLLSRPRWAPWAEAALYLSLVLIGLIAVPALRPLRAALLFGAAAASAQAGGVGLFAWHGWLIDVANPSAAAGAVFVFMVLAALSQVEFQRRRLRLELDLSREEQERTDIELATARRIQSGMLPNPRAVLGDDPRVDLAALMQPARTVGGDLYDFFRVDEARLFFVIGDVSGKGLPASLFMALSKALIRVAAQHAGAHPGRSLAEAGRLIAQENPENLFVSAVAAVLDLNSGELSWCSAGHDNPLSLRKGQARAVSLETAGGPALCMVERFQYPSERRRLEPGEVLCLFTDGVTEASNRAGELYGLERLALCLGGSGDMSSSKRIERVQRDVERFSQGEELADDLTVLLLRWNGPPTVR